jgi:hypothetical protein
MGKNTTLKDGDALNAESSSSTREKCPKCNTFWLYHTMDKQGNIYKNCREAHKWDH